MRLERRQGKSPPDPVQQLALLPGCSWFLQEHQEWFTDLSHVDMRKPTIQATSLFIGKEKNTNNTIKVN